MKSKLTKVALCLLAAACSPAEERGEGAPGEREAGVVSANGMSFNGMSFNGMSFNGMSFNGMSFNGMSFNGAKLNGMSFNGMSFNGSELVGVGTDGVERRGAELVGAELRGLFANGSTVPMRVDGARAAGGVWFYRISATTDAGQLSPCGLDGAGAPIEAIALAGRWDTRQGVPGGGAWIDDPAAFTFACRGAALAKCVELGYEPWSSAGGVSLRDHHQACVRLLRADYCGNGQTGTIDGWQVNLYDNLGIQADTEGGPQWVFEGSWGASGAACVDEYRVLELVASGPVPECALAKLSGSCAAGGFQGGVLMRNEYNSTGVVGLVRDIVTGNPDTQLADKVEDALGSLEVSFAELAKSPPDRLAALGKFEGAVGDLKAAVDDDSLPAGYGSGLVNRITGVARFQARTVIDANACGAQKPKDLSDAKKKLAEGDQERAKGKYKEACAKYKEAVDKAEDALGSPCTAP